MKIIVIGAGASGAMFAIARKRSHPKDEILLLEHLDKPLKKILATGNGKCNLGNKSSLKGKYNNDLALDILERYDFDTQRKFLDSINIKTKLVDDLLYPISESAVTVRNALIKELERSKVTIKCEETITEYLVNDNYIEVFTDKGSYKCDKLVFASGGKSSPKLGSDGSVLTLLKDHGYTLKEVNPGLCPIYTKEKTKELDGIRVKANVSLFKDGKKVFNEDGEVLFKEHGLSGIVIYNASRIIANDLSKKYEIALDLLPNEDRDELGLYLSTSSPRALLDAYLNPKLADYLYEKRLSGVKLINEIKSCKFTFDRLYGFDNSQVSIGGVSLKEIDASLKSARENNIYFIGECLDIDGSCGGFNLMWAFGSALYISDHM